MQHRVLRRAAIVAMRALADNGGSVIDPKHVRHLRDVHQRFPKFITIAPAPEGAAPRPFFLASLTPAGAAIIRQHDHEVHR